MATKVAPTTFGVFPPGFVDEHCSADHSRAAAAEPHDPVDGMSTSGSPVTCTSPQNGCVIDETSEVPSFNEAADWLGEPLSSSASSVTADDNAELRLAGTQQDDATGAAVSTTTDQGPNTLSETEAEQLSGPPPVPPLLVALDLPRALNEQPTEISIEWSPPLLQLALLEVAAGSAGTPGPVPPCSYEYELHCAQFHPDDPLAPQQWNTAYVGTDTRAQVVGLARGRLYAFRVHCTVVFEEEFAGEPPIFFSEQVLAATVATPPVGQSPPTVASRQRTLLKFRWAPPVSDGGREVTNYCLYLRPAPAEFAGTMVDGFALVYSGMEMTAKVARLQPGQVYYARLQCCNELGNGEFSRTIETATQATVPSPPEEPIAHMATPNEVVLRWSAPFDNGEPVTNFVLERNDGFGGPFEAVVYNGPLTECTVRGLQSGREYCFRLAAFNRKGISMWSPTASVRTGLGKAGPPKAVCIMTTSPDSIVLSWQGPKDTGGGEVLSYQVRLQLRSGPPLGADLSPNDWLLAYHALPTAATIGGLQAGCSYKVKICAETSAGLGAFTYPMDCHTTAAKPWPPRQLSMHAAGPTSLLLEWEPPEHDCGAEVVAYRVQLWDADAGPSVSAGHRSSSGTPSVANGSNGAHSASAHSPSMSPVPDASTNGSAHPGKLKGSAKQLVARAADSGWTVYEGPDRRCLVDALAPGRRYGAHVVAINRMGLSKYSQPAFGRTLPAPPLAPAICSTPASSTATSLGIKWTEPESQGAPVAGYTLQCSAGSAQPQMHCLAEMQRLAASEGATAAATGEQHEQAQQQQADEHGADELLQTGSAASENGIGSERCPSSATGTSSAGDHSSSGLADDDSSGLFSVVYHGAEPHATITRLQPFTHYVIRARAHNTAGKGPWSPWVELRTEPSVPSPPREVLAAGESSTSVRVTWQPPVCCHGSDITAYTVESSPAPSYRSQLHWTHAWHGLDTSCIVQRLVAGRPFIFRVRAANGVGHGDWCETPAKAATLPAPPGLCLGLAYSNRTPNSIRIKWQPPLEDGGTAMEEYSVYMAGGSAGSDEFVLAYSGTDTIAKVEGLSPGQRYTFRVKARNCAGWGAYSDTLSVVTARPPPLVPQHVRAEVGSADASGDGAGRSSSGGSAEGAGLAHNVLTVCWEPPAATASRADVAGYEVEVVNVSAHPPARSCTAVSNKVQSWRMQSPARIGAAYQVRVRSIGGDSSGHGAWSEPVTCEVPAAPTERAGALVGTDAAAGAAVGEAAVKTAKQRKSKGGGNKAAPAAGSGRVASGTKDIHLGVAAARAPPRKLSLVGQALHMMRPSRRMRLRIEMTLTFGLTVYTGMLICHFGRYYWLCLSPFVALAMWIAWTVWKARWSQLFVPARTR